VLFVRRGKCFYNLKHSRQELTHGEINGHPYQAAEPKGLAITQIDPQAEVSSGRKPGDVGSGPCAREGSRARPPEAQKWRWRDFARQRGTRTAQARAQTDLERRARIKEYKTTLAIMKKRGVKGLAPRTGQGRARAQDGHEAFTGVRRR
jgi:hypothetical protein